MDDFTARNQATAGTSAWGRRGRVTRRAGMTPMVGIWSVLSCVKRGKRVWRCPRPPSLLLSCSSPTLDSAQSPFHPAPDTRQFPTLFRQALPPSRSSHPCAWLSSVLTSLPPLKPTRGPHSSALPPCVELRPSTCRIDVHLRLGFGGTSRQLLLLRQPSSRPGSCNQGC